MKLRISRDDFLRGKLVEPAWYAALIKDIVEETSKKGDSQNWRVDFIIIEDGPFKDVPVQKYFNEKAPGVAIPFFTACNGGKEIEADKEYDFSACKGRKVRIYIGNRTFENRLVNEVTDFRALQ
jgi:hypothetical protein